MPQSKDKIRVKFAQKTHLEDLKDINTSFALFNASAKAEFGSTGAAGGGGTLLKACIASAIFQHVKKKRNDGSRPRGMMVYVQTNPARHANHRIPNVARQGDIRIVS